MFHLLLINIINFLKTNELYFPVSRDHSGHWHHALLRLKVKVNLDMCKAPLNAIAFSKAIRYGNRVLPANMPYLPLLPSRRASPPFGWYSFYRPTEGRRLSRPGWLVTYRNKMSPRQSCRLTRGSAVTGKGRSTRISDIMSVVQMHGSIKKTWKRRLAAAYPQSPHLHKKVNIYNSKSATEVGVY